MRTLAEKIAAREFAPYVYSYPPARMFVPADDIEPSALKWADDLNVYVHIPFCAQKCTFCGYLTAIDDREGTREAYVDAVVREIASRRDILGPRRITSVNFGGGTPSLLTAAQLLRILDALVAANPDLPRTATEISIEATPESAVSGPMSTLLMAGFNRVSIGIQSFDDIEIAGVNRHNDSAMSVRAIRALHDLGVPNVCADLMYGLPGQPFGSWRASVESLVALRPETVELYATALVPGTAMARKAGVTMSPSQRHRSYLYARDAFLASGYAQDAHLRFILPGKGGYHQQANVFAGQSMLGFGVGARSQAFETHFRNVTAGGNGRLAIREYILAMKEGRSAITDAIRLPPWERMRRYVIGRLEFLDLRAFRRAHSGRFQDEYPNTIRTLLDLGLATMDDQSFRLTAEGLAFRDLIAHAFFSNAAREAENRYRPQLPILPPTSTTDDL